MILSQGNFGSIDGDPPAMRYTETKLGRIAQFLTEDLEKYILTTEAIMTKPKKSQKCYLHNILIF